MPMRGEENREKKREGQTDVRESKQEADTTLPSLQAVMEVLSWTECEKR